MAERLAPVRPGPIIPSSKVATIATPTVPPPTANGPREPFKVPSELSWS